MLFNSFDFLLFFPIVTVLFYLLKHEHRWALLLAASCYFYMYFIPAYILILIGTIIIDYYAGILIESETRQKQKKIFLFASIAANVGILAVFKYYNFFLDNVNLAGTWINGHPTAIRYLGIALPIGLSFHTFQAMSYTFEVYYGRQKAERKFGYYALYVMFYPQLVAGPIERPQNILHQFHEEKKYKYENVRDGLLQMLWGFFKKIVVADNISGMVNLAYTHPEQQTGLTLLLATYLFAIQIYCDFSGYSDIAIGAAKTMGFDLMENFKTPYISKNIKEFWTRWHISLSTWFKDYLYIPIGGNRVKISRMMINLMIVFVISGIWHGANWNFIIWGFLHGLYLILAIQKDIVLKALKIPENMITNTINMFVTFHLVVFAWIFFRATTFTDAAIIIKSIAHTKFGIQHLIHSLDVFSVGEKNLGRTLFLFTLIGGFMLADPKMDKIAKNKLLFKNKAIKYITYSLVMTGIILFGFFGDINFIYFQF